MRGVRTVAVTAVVAMALAAPSSWAQPKKLVFWTHWEQNPEFNKFYETRGKDFGQKTGYEVQVVTVPYQGYEAKYLAALMGKSGAPDIFMGMTHHWCGQYDFCDKMPADLARTWDENLPKYMLNVGKWKGTRYGIPIEHGNFQQMYIDTELFKKAGLDPDKPPKTLDDWLAAMKKLTVLDAKGEPTQVGFALRHKGHPVGITDKFLPFAHAFGARMLSPNLEKGTGNAKDDLDQHQAQGILPVWTANLDSAYVKSRPDYQSTQEMLRQPVPPEYYHPKSNELATAFGEAVVAALYGKGQPKPLLDEAAAKMDRVLKD